jgi:hypothetical protein
MRRVGGEAARSQRPREISQGEREKGRKVKKMAKSTKNKTKQSERECV